MPQVSGRAYGGQSEQASITVFLPCYNEVANVERTVRQAVECLEKLNADFELIIVDDGSTDGTAQIAQRLAAENGRIRVVRHPVNRGYGTALQSGFRAATKELVFYTDGDGQFDIAELPPLLELMRQYDIVSCYRLNRRDGPMRRFNGWCWTKLVCFLFGMKLRDVDCAFKLYKRKIFDNMRILSTGALVDAEILARATRKGYTTTQIGVHHYPRRAGTATGAKPMVLWRALKELWRYRKDIVSNGPTGC
jgi:glycosyltransferase involved in cell wall biosynthesis